MKAIIKVARKGSIFAAVARQIAGARDGRTPDFYLSFESARALFAELTPARLDLLDTRRRIGPRSVSVLATVAGCDDRPRCGHGRVAPRGLGSDCTLGR